MTHFLFKGGKSLNDSIISGKKLYFKKKASIVLGSPVSPNSSGLISPQTLKTHCLQPKQGREYKD